MPIHIGIDLGSTTVKVALVTSDPEDGALLGRLSGAAQCGPPRVVRPDNGPSEWLSVVAPTTLAGSPAAQARRMLEGFVSALGPTCGTVVGTGSGAGILERELGIAPVSEFLALTRDVELLLPTVLTLFEMGGEKSRYFRFERRGSYGELVLADHQSNGDCAAGTGAFLDQQARRLRFRTEDMGAIALAASRSPQIVGRCSVFARSDMVHAQQKAFTPEEIVRGLCDAVARNYRSSMTKGRSIAPDVALVGGVAANAGVVRALERAYGWEPGTLIVHANHASFAAIGAAMLAHRQARSAIQHSTDPARALPLRQHFSAAPPLSMANVLLLRDRLSAVPDQQIVAGTDAYLGIDIGSVSTNLVVIDEAGRLLREIYLRTNARPLQAVGAGLRELKHSLGSRIRIRGVGTTGSGRELTAEFVGADVVKDEITAHKTGADFIDRRLLGLGVDTIFEIGGQDAKYIGLQDGVVVDFAMNEACAAGTGSFLEECARDLGIRIECEFADIALASAAPIRLGDRCTVFMERDINDCLRRGALRGDVVAGLAHSVAANYINRVVRGRRIGEVIFFQGGTAYNDAVAAALSGILGKRIIVPPFNGVIGALGVAQIVREWMRTRGVSSRFRGYTFDDVDYATKEFVCKGCTNHCEMQRITIDGVDTYWGDKCSVRYRKTVRVERKPVADDLVATRQAHLLAGYDPAAGSGPTIGLPFCMSTYDWAPFWFAVFRDLGVRVLLSVPTMNGIVALGLETTVSEPCFPVQVAHGHLRWLLDNGADFLFVPNNIAAPGDPRRKPSYFCPWNQTLPFVARCAPVIFERRDRVISPTLWFNQGASAIAAALRQALSEVGLHWRARAVKNAVTRGLEALASFRCALSSAGRVTVSALDASGRHSVVLLGRPYNIYDKGVNLGIAAKVRQHYGIDVVGFDCLPIDSQVLASHEDRVFWSYGARLLAAAAFVRSRPNMHLIYVTNFKCGPDSYVKHYVAAESGRPILTLQFDGHNNDAGVLTRCEAYLDSKGAFV